MAAVLTGTFLVALAFLARRPATEAHPSILHIQVMHDSTLPTRVQAAPPATEGKPGQPRLLAAVDSQLDRQIISWSYSFGDDRITVHRLASSVDLPKNREVETVGSLELATFRLGDLNFLSWTDSQDRSLFVVGTAPSPRLAELGQWLRDREEQSPPAPQPGK
ncbi:MAG: hypothetical protein VX498_13635 [Myxococcota bacterium]|nr:hypothetical protein [Myxococcota bacterium]